MLIIQIKTGRTKENTLMSQGNKFRLVKQVSKMQPSVISKGTTTAVDRVTVMAYSPVACKFQPTVSGSLEALRNARQIATTSTGSEIITPLNIHM